MDEENGPDNALVELTEFYAFYMELSELPAEKILGKIAQRYPEFIEHIEAMNSPPQSSADLCSQLGSWFTSSIRNKYSTF